MEKWGSGNQVVYNIMYNIIVYNIMYNIIVYNIILTKTQKLGRIDRG